MNLVNNYKIGSDIEWFLQNKNTGEIVSAEGLILGTKEQPYHFDPNNHFYATSLDNVMAEGNIPPAVNAEEFYKNIVTLENYIKNNIPTDLTTASLPSARLDFKYLMTENAQVFGCQPSLNCWSSEEVYPMPSGDNARCAGFHIHVGYDNPNEETNKIIAQCMDLFLGVPSVLIEPTNERKSIGYGKASNYRNQKHGAEYRTLSSYFSSSKKLVTWCFANTVKAIEMVNSKGNSLIEDLGGYFQDVINNEDKESAKSIVSQFNIALP